MEELRKDAKRLAIINVVLQTAYIALALFAVGLFLSDLSSHFRIKGFTAFLSIIGFPLFGVLFVFWLQFLDKLKRSYEGNHNVLNAVRMGRVAIWFKIAYLVVGIFASLILVSKNGLMQLSITAKDFGLEPSGGAGIICEALLIVNTCFSAFMYLLFADASERKSEIRIIALALALLTIVYYTWNANADNITIGILQHVLFIGESMFLWRIYKGDTFIDNK